MAVLEELSVDECWDRLRSGTLGRIAIVRGGEPEVYPFNYAAEAPQLVFRTEAGSLLARAAGTRAAFEIDGYDEGSGEGWSVLAHGTVHDIDETLDRVSESLRRLTVHTVAPGRRHHWMALYVDAVSGRRFRGGGEG